MVFSTVLTVWMYYIKVDNTNEREK